MGFSNNIINNEFIKFFKYKNDKNGISEMNTFYGQKWSDLKINNKTLNSIFTQIQVDYGDGIVQANELNKLNKIFNYIDKQKKDGILDENELKDFDDKLKCGKINIEDILNESKNSTTGIWSEGLDRNISTIKLSKIHQNNTTFVNELKEIGKEQGFSIDFIESGNSPWVEDSSIRRHDGKIYIPLHSNPDDLIELNVQPFVSERGNENVSGQGAIVYEGHAFSLNIDSENKYYGTSYLEGGNVLNTKNSDGKPAAIVGEESIGLSLELMRLENTPENVNNVKEQIAKDLGLESNQVTFIPQHEFHIDMIYHPLKNGEIAIPDYQKGIELLEEQEGLIKESIQEEKSNLGNVSQSNSSPPSLIEKIRLLRQNQEHRLEQNKTIDKLQRELLDIHSRIDDLKELDEKTRNLRQEANDNLQAGGYTLVKIPCFTTKSNDSINFMNGVGGTSKKTGETFYITNKSKNENLQNVIEKYLKDAGIDKVYFISTTSFLKRMGGIDCLTQEE